jgi:glucokinase
MNDNDYILAFDFGGTKLTAALFSAAALAAADPAPLARRRVFSPENAAAGSDQRMMVALGRDLLGERRPAALGVSFGGPVDYAAGLVRLSHHVPGWENIPLQARLEAEFICPVRVDNDANVAALGEQRFGAGQGRESLFYVTVSTGVGGGWVLDGRPWRGCGGMAGEIGHTVVDPAGPLCLCGKRGCVERLASGPYMAADLAAAWQRDGREVNEPVTGKTVAEAAAGGDAAARRILRRGAWALGTGLGNAANLVNPGRFVLGGGVTKAGDAWWESVRQTARETALPEVEFDVVPAALGDDAPLWGALALAAPILEEREAGA